MNYWAQSYHAEGSIWCTAVQKTTSGFILVGNAGDPGAMGASCVFLIMKLDANGKPKWRKTFHHIPYFRQATCIQEVNGNYFVAGYTIEQGNYATLVIKLNAKGIASWTKIFASSEYHTIPSSMLDTHDGGVAIAGRIEEVQTSNQDFWVLKLNANGDYEWQKAYDYRYFVGQDLRRANETAISIARTVGGGYIVAGNLSTQLGDNDLWILELDSFGNLGSNTRIGGQGNDQVTSMVLTSNHSPDPAFVLAGFTNSVGDGSFNMFAAKCQFIAPQPPLLARIGVLWGKAYELYGPDYGYSIDQTTDGDFVLAGSCYMPQTNSLDALILKLRSADGSFIWSRGRVLLCSKNIGQWVRHGWV